MILTVPLQPGTLLANVRYRWLAAGAIGAQLATGISQPSGDWPVFRFDVEPPEDAEELIAYDELDLGNWNTGSYKIAAAANLTAAAVIAALQTDDIDDSLDALVTLLNAIADRFAVAAQPGLSGQFKSLAEQIAKQRQDTFGG
jgi:hypothetical protein